MPIFVACEWTGQQRPKSGQKGRVALFNNMVIPLIRVALVFAFQEFLSRFLVDLKVFFVLSSQSLSEERRKFFLPSQKRKQLFLPFRPFPNIIIAFFTLGKVSFSLSICLFLFLSLSAPLFFTVSHTLLFCLFVSLSLFDQSIFQPENIQVSLFLGSGPKGLMSCRTQG